MSVLYNFYTNFLDARMKKKQLLFYFTSVNFTIDNLQRNIFSEKTARSLSVSFYIMKPMGL